MAESVIGARRATRDRAICALTLQLTVGKVQMIAKRLRVATAACCTGLGVVIAIGGCSSSQGPTTAAEQVKQRDFTGTIRSKTFEIDESAYTTGQGNVSAVGLVDLRIGDEPTRHGARTGFGKFQGSPLRWTLDDTMYFADGSIKSTGLCVTSADAGGSFTARCKLTIDSGSGSFQGATGTNEYTCRVASADVNAIANCAAKGSVAY